MDVSALNKKVTDIIYSNTLYFGITEIVEYILFLVLVYIYNPFDIVNKYENATKITVILTGVMYMILFWVQYSKGRPSGINETNILTKVGLTLIIFIFASFVLKYILIFLAHRSVAIGIFYLALFGGLTYFALIYINGVKTLSMNIIYFLKQQYDLTNIQTKIVLAIEAIIIMSFIIVPTILQKYYTSPGIQLLKEPENLNQQSNVGSFEELYGDIDKPINFNYHYALSMWFYINSNPPNTNGSYSKYSNLLSYGGKPAIEYNALLNKLRVRVVTDNITPTFRELEIYNSSGLRLQRWNNIVVNYDHGTMDVFLNGALVGSLPSVSPYMSIDNIVIGSSNGLYGGVCNVNFYKENLSLSYIQDAYNSLKNNNAPYH